MAVQAAVLMILVGTALCLDPPRVCQTPECLALSALITSNMNLTADPCEDFNEFACGHYARNNPYEPTLLTWSPRFGQKMMMKMGMEDIVSSLTKRTFEMLLLHRSVSAEDPDVNVMYKLASGLFRSCTSWVRVRNQKRQPSSDSDDTATVAFEGLLSHLVDSFPPQTQKGWFERALAKMVRYGVWDKLQIVQSEQFQRAKKQSLRTDNLTYVGLREKLSFPSAKSFSDYLDFFGSLPSAKSFQFDSRQDGEFNKVAEELSSIRSGSASDANSKNCTPSKYFPSRDDFSVKIRDLDRFTSECLEPNDPFSWSVFFSAVLDGSVSPDTMIEFSDVMRDVETIAMKVTYMKQGTVSLGSTGTGKFSTNFSFIVFDWLLTFAPFFPATLAERYANDPISRGSIDFPFRDDPVSECIRFTKSLLAPVVERMFQKRYHDANFDRVRDLVFLVQKATIANVRSERWITETSKTAIIHKIESLKKEIGFNVISTAEMKSMYRSAIQEFKKINVTANYTNFGILVSVAMCAFASRTNNLLSKDADPTSFSTFDPLRVNAFNTMSGNQIVFPMGILSPFLYHNSFPDYMNLGGIGFIVGHEIGHGFDDTGHKLRSNGSSGHIWDNATEQGFLQQMSCVISRYGSYQLIPGVRHFSTSTVGNDISDLIGIRSAFRALQLLGERGRSLRLPNLPETLTPEKLLFVQAAQAWCSKYEDNAVRKIFGRSSHSPPYLRIRGMMENSKDFADVFKCKKGQAMNPPDKCQLW